MKTKEELLKIFSAYLPYGVKVSPIHILNYGSSQGNGIGSLIHMLTTNSQTYKLHLYSMDMLTKEIEHKGERFVPLHKILEEYCFDLSKMDDREILSYAESLIEIDMTVTTYNLLLEWHFNVFNLEESEYIKKQPVIQK